MRLRGMIVSMCLLCLCLFSFTTVAGPPVARFDDLRFSLNRYQKAVISGQTLYMNTAPHVSEEHQGHLIRISLYAHPEPQLLWDYVGVHAVKRSISERRMVSVENQYPFCWDIAGETLVAIDIGGSWRRGGPFFVLFRIPLADIAILREKILEMGETFLGKSAISDLYPLANLFDSSTAPRDQRSRVFFDIVPFDRQKFHLYIAHNGKMTIWNYDQAMHEVMMATRDWSIKSSYERYMEARETSWVPMRSFPVDFEGPFRIIRLNDTIYIFSEHLRTVYRYEGDKLVPLIHLPPLPETDSSTGLEQVFVVDKDQQRVIFWIPSAEHPDDPDVMTLGKSAPLSAELIPAVQAAMKLMPQRTETK